MATYCASVLIAQLRKQKGLSQEKLAEGICDRRTISYIETGKISPSKFVFERLMQRLGVDPRRYSSYIFSSAEMRFESARQEIEQLYREGKTDELEALLQSLESDKQLKSNIFVTQFIQKTRAWQLAGGMDWDNAGDSALPGMLCEAIRLTLPAFDLDRIGENLYTLVEFDLIRMLGLWKLYTGDHEKSLRIFRALEDTVKTGYIYSQDIAGSYASLMVSLAKNYRWLKRNNEALAASERGTAMCLSCQEYACLPWLLYQKASAIYWLGDKTQCLAILDDALILSKNYREKEFASFIETKKQYFSQERI